MSNKITSPKNANQYYETSKLNFYLKHDEWSPQLGLCLICDIDFANLQIDDDFEPRYTQGDIEDGLVPPDVPLSDIDLPLFDRMSLLSEHPVYCLRPALEPDEQFFDEEKKYLEASAIKSAWYDDVDVDIDFLTLLLQIENRGKAKSKLHDVWALYFSRSAHVDEPRRSPEYFISWAEEKGIEIPWLKWAIDSGIIKAGQISSRTTAKRPELGPRKEATYLRIIGALLELLTGETKGKANSIYKNLEAVVSELVTRYGKKDGISERTLDAKFALAKKTLSSE